MLSRKARSRRNVAILPRNTPRHLALDENQSDHFGGNESDDSLDRLLAGAESDEEEQQEQEQEAPGRSRFESLNEEEEPEAASKGSSEGSLQETKIIDASAANTPAGGSEAGTPEVVAELTQANQALNARREALINRRMAAMQGRRSGARAATPTANSVRSARSTRHSAVTPGARTPAQRQALIERRKQGLARAKQRAQSPGEGENKSPDAASTPAHSRRNAGPSALTPSQKKLIERRQAAQQSGGEAGSTRAGYARSMRNATSTRARSMRAASSRFGGQRPPRPTATPRNKSLLTPRERTLYERRGKTPRGASAPTPRDRALGQIRKQQQAGRRKFGITADRGARRGGTPSSSSHAQP